MISSNPTTDPSYLTASTTFEDSIAKICWYPSDLNPLLAVSSWDSKIRIYSVNSGPSIEEKATIQTENPCLAVCWPNDPVLIAAGSIDGTVSVFDIWSGGRAVLNCGKHDDAVQGIYQMTNSPLLCSVSYDQTLKAWDMRQQGTAVKTINLGAKPVCSNMAFPYMIVGLSNQKFYVFNIRNALETLDVGPQMETTLGPDSPLSSVSITSSCAIGLGSSSGRSAVSWLFRSLNDAKFTMSGTYCFKAHKLEPGQSGNESNVRIQYPINAVGLHPQIRDTYFTAGTDGFIHFWNLDKRSRLTGFSSGGVPVTEAKWSPDSNFVAYGIGYDWSKGIEGTKSYKTELRIHNVQSNEVVNNAT